MSWFEVAMQHLRVHAVPWPLLEDLMESGYIDSAISARMFLHGQEQYGILVQVWRALSKGRGRPLGYKIRDVQVLLHILERFLDSQLVEYSVQSPVLITSAGQAEGGFGGAAPKPSLQRREAPQPTEMRRSSAKSKRTKEPKAGQTRMYDHGSDHLDARKGSVRLASRPINATTTCFGHTVPGPLAVPPVSDPTSAPQYCFALNCLLKGPQLLSFLPPSLQACVQPSYPCVSAMASDLSSSVARSSAPAGLGNTASQASTAVTSSVPAAQTSQTVVFPRLVPRHSVPALTSALSQGGVRSSTVNVLPLQETTACTANPWIHSNVFASDKAAPDKIQVSHMDSDIATPCEQSFSTPLHQFLFPPQTPTPLSSTLSTAQTSRSTADINSTLCGSHLLSGQEVSEEESVEPSEKKMKVLKRRRYSRAEAFRRIDRGLLSPVDTIKGADVNKDLVKWARGRITLTNLMHKHKADNYVQLLQCAIDAGSRENFMQLLNATELEPRLDEQVSLDLETPLTNRWPLLWHAALRGDLFFTIRLLEKGAHMYNTRDPEYPTLLHRLAESHTRLLEVMRWLLRRRLGMDVRLQLNTLNRSANTVLHLVLQHNPSAFLLAFLIRAGAATNLVNGAGLTPAELHSERQQHGLDKMSATDEACILALLEGKATALDPFDDHPEMAVFAELHEDCALTSIEAFASIEEMDLADANTMGKKQQHEVWKKVEEIEEPDERAVEPLSLVCALGNIASKAMRQNAEMLRQQQTELHQAGTVKDRQDGGRTAKG